MLSKMGFKSLIIEKAKRKKSRLILALDFTDKEPLNSAKDKINQLHNSLVGVKLNQHILLPLSIKDVSRIVRTAHDKDLLTIADLKLSDISSTNLVACKHIWNAGFDALILSPLPGYEDGVGPVISDAHDRGKGVIMLAMMSNKGAEEFFEVKLKNDKNLYELFLNKAVKWDIDGIIVGATNLKVLKKAREVIGKNLLIFSPGIGVQGGKAKDAINCGSDFIIVGRSIIKSSNPSYLVERMRQESWISS